MFTLSNMMTLLANVFGTLSRFVLLSSCMNINRRWYDIDSTLSLAVSLLEKAEKAWKDLKMERINKVYEFLIEDIEALGSTYSFEKISDYYAIVDVLDRMDKYDKRYIDTTNVDKFKTEFDEYFKELSEDINTLDDINTLPTTTVNKVGVAIAVSIIGGSSLFALAGLFFKKYWLF